MPSSSPSHFRASEGASGFSLIEVVIAIAVIAVALVGILGLFPIALDAATNSQQETQAALIARTLYTDLDSRSDTKRLLLVSTNSTDSNAEPDTKEIDLTEQTISWMAYNTDGQPLGKIEEGVFNIGKKEAAFLARVKVDPQQAIPNGTNSTVNDLSRIEVSVQAPGSAPEKARKKYTFISLFRQGALLVPLPPPAPPTP
jgi:uncharacterized protein (TIGR02598 family)